MKPKTIEESWKTFDAFDHWDLIKKQLRGCKDMIPAPKNIFRAFSNIDVKRVRVVIIGMSPYFNPQDATGLAFGIPDVDRPYKKWPPSLRYLAEGLFREYHDCGEQWEMKNIQTYFDPTLHMWEEQGILLLNSALTCTFKNANVHIPFWTAFVNDLIEQMNEYFMGRHPLVFYLLGAEAKKKRRLINETYHRVFEDRHPAYYSRMEEPMNTKFRTINQIYQEQHGIAVDWILPF